MRERLRKWCENGLARITDDIAELQMHKAIRNLTRLFERIQDFEKRVIKRRGQLDRADAEALVAALDPARPGAGPVRPAHRRGDPDRLRPGRRRELLGALARRGDPVASRARSRLPERDPAPNSPLEH